MMTIWGFVGIGAIFGIAGFAMIHYEKKYNMINAASTTN
ncbi:major facilitator superfamily protein [Lentilactobacillus otakiensis DSM 19908 = JCM 15040]|uniref:Major facilitator superfamily protein n=1 Tax=Lentilactobacillus otakiensis DSM 19908 = JCM 15040 TaxID=1423780 RepID=S4NDE7_9LACO|nr:major facilitator superfamily protein [Lentilactobacillus otakiensis DSM 19908 = JCM 15040]